MLKCPFCQFDNEDGALFCEQCKSDLATVASTPAVPAAMPFSPEPVPMAAILDEPIGLAPMAERIEVLPDMATIPVAMPEPIPLAGWEPIPLAAVETLAPEPVVIPPLEIAPVVAAPAIPAAPPVVAPPPAFEPVVAAPVVADAAAAPAPTDAAKLPADAKPKLVVIRGQKINQEFPIYPDLNFIGRADEKPVDIDLEDQEPPDKIWCSRQHALVTYEDGLLTLEDLNSANGTFVNRTRVYPGQKRQLNVNDVIQIGTVHLRVMV